MSLQGTRVGGIHQKAASNPKETSLPSCASFQQHFRPLCWPMCTKSVENTSAPPSLEYFNCASTQTALPATPTPWSYTGANQNTAHQGEQEERGGVWGGEDAQRPIHHHHLTKLMLQKQHLSLIHLIYATVLSWLRQVQPHPSKDHHLSVLQDSKM